MKKFTYDEAMDELLRAKDGSLLDYETSMAIMDAISPVLQKHPENNDNWDDFWEMLNNIKTYAATNHQIIEQNDNPFKLKIGYKCTNTGKTWAISLSNLKLSLDKIKETDPVKYDILSRAFQTADGKENLLKVLNGK